ncbi:MAG: hypothetical protein WKG07_14050 [Hymenobacter sp.]
MLWASKVEEVSSQKAQGKAPSRLIKRWASLIPYPWAKPAMKPGRPARTAPTNSSTVRFAKSIIAQQVTVIENVNPGAVTKIELIDIKGERHVVYTNPNPGLLPVGFRTLQVKFKPEKYRTIGAKVTLNGAKVTGDNQIDAIGIANVDVQIVRQDFKNPASTDVEAVRDGFDAQKPGADREQQVRGYPSGDFARRAHHVLRPAVSPRQPRPAHATRRIFGTLSSRAVKTRPGARPKISAPTQRPRGPQRPGLRVGQRAGGAAHRRVRGWADGA